MALRWRHLTLAFLLSGVSVIPLTRCLAQEDEKTKSKLVDPDEAVPDASLPRPTPTPSPSPTPFLRKATPTASVTTLPPPTHAEEPLVWEAEHATSSYTIAQTPLTFERLLTAYERLVEFRCMGELQRSLAHQSGTNDPRCLHYLDRLLELDPNSSIGICARDGIDSRSCSDADTRNLYIVHYGGSERKGPLGQLLDDKLAREKQQALISRHKNEISTLTTRLASPPISDADREKQKGYRERLAELYRELLNAGCADPVITTAPASDASRLRKEPLDDLQSLQEALFRKTPTPRPTPGSRTRQEDVEILRKLEPTPTPAPTPFVRVRKLSRDCMRFAKSLVDLTPLSSAAECVLHGRYSPKCIDARRRERAHARKSGTGTPAPAGSSPQSSKTPASKGFDTF